MSLAKITLEFSGPTTPKMDSIHFEHDGYKSPGKVLVGKKGILKDNRQLHWGRAVKSLALVLIRYRLANLVAKRSRKNSAPTAFHETIDSYPYLNTIWGAVSKPTWIDLIFGEDDYGHDIKGHHCTFVFKSRNTKAGKSFEICDATLPAENVIFKCDQWKNETIEGLETLYELILPAFSQERKKVVHPPNGDLHKLQIAEAILGSEAEIYRLTQNRLNSLHHMGLAALIHHGDDKIFTTPDLGVLAAVVEGNNTITDASTFTLLQEKTVKQTLPKLKKFIRVADDRLEIIPQQWNTIIFDWADTLVDEFNHDEALCAFIPQSKTPRQTLIKNEQFKKILHQLEYVRSKFWYDYLYLGKQFGRSSRELELQTNKLGSKLRPLCNVNDLLEKIHKKGIKPVLATNCHRTILEWRAKILGIRLDLFDLVVTSDQMEDVRDKKAHFEYVIEKLHLTPHNTAVVSDDLKKDLVPAKSMGFATIWVISKKHQTPAYPEPSRSTAQYGSPNLPVDPNVHDLTRRELNGRAADYCVTSADKILRLVG